MDAIGIQAAGRHHFLYFGNVDFRGSGHGIIEVTSRFAEYEITRLGGLPFLYDTGVGTKSPLPHIFLPLAELSFPSLRNQAAEPGLGIKTRQSPPTHPPPPHPQSPSRQPPHTHHHTNTP